jgi:hypothetical protein
MIKIARTTPTIAATGALLDFVAPVGVMPTIPLSSSLVADGEGRMTVTGGLAAGGPVTCAAVELGGVRVGIGGVEREEDEGIRMLDATTVLDVITGRNVAKDEGNWDLVPVVVERPGGRVFPAFTSSSSSSSSGPESSSESDSPSRSESSSDDSSCTSARVRRRRLFWCTRTVGKQRWNFVACIVSNLEMKEGWLFEEC